MRILLGGWGLYFFGLVLAFLFPGQILKSWGVPLIIFGILLGISTFGYCFVYIFQRRIKTDVQPANPFERVLIVVWIMFVGIAIMAVLFPTGTYVPGPETLLILWTIVVSLVSTLCSVFAGSSRDQGFVVVGWRVAGNKIKYNSALIVIFSLGFVVGWMRRGKPGAPFIRGLCE